ncbi:hypothetical protein D3C71_258870 [compost metagenome]
MQGIRIPYETDEAGAKLVAEIRRIQSCAVRTAYANAVRENGTKRSEKDVREIVKSRLSKLGIVDSWALHCATRIGVARRKTRPDGDVVFGGRAMLERRRKRLISNEQWRAARLGPLVSYGDRQKPFGNQNVHLIDELMLVVKIGRKEGGGRSGRTVTDKAVLKLQPMRGRQGAIIRQVVALCAHKEQKGRINITFSIDETHVTVIIDPADLPNHPERRVPIHAVKGRALGIDLNPNWIGMAVAGNTTDSAKISVTKLLQHELVKLDLPKDASAELVRETLAAVCDCAIRLCRRWHVGTITVEKGLGKLRSSGKNRSLNRLLNYWARAIFVAMLTRKARLAGIDVIEVWGSYSSTIGNLAFEAPDACASAAELARRGIARLAGIKDVLPELEEGWNARLWKNELLPAELGSWKDIHRTIKSTGIGYRRPHPDPKDRGSDGRLCGHAASRLRHRNRPGWKIIPQRAAAMRSGADSVASCSVAATATSYAT